MKILLNEIVEDVSNIEMINSYIYENMIVYINEYPHDIAHMNFEDVFYENINEIIVEDANEKNLFILLYLHYYNYFTFPFPFPSPFFLFSSFFPQTQ